MRQLAGLASEHQLSGKGGVVVSPHPLASEAGAAVLRSGGTAIEAAIAVGSTLAVVYPHFCGLGGDSVWIVADAKGRKSCFLGIGQAAEDVGHFDGGIPLRGPKSTLTTACAVDAWRHAHQYSSMHWGGNLDFAGLLDDAVRHAERGFPITRSQLFWLGFRSKEVAVWPGFASLFMPGGREPSEGEIFRQPELADSLRLIAQDVPNSFYEGTLARKIAKGLADVGSPITLRDLALTRTQEVEPVSLLYRGLELLAPPPPTQGISTLTIMGVLEHFDLSEFGAGGADHLHFCIEAVKQAFLGRGDIADPRFVSQAVNEWLSAKVLGEKAGAVNPGHAMEWPAVYRDGDTVFFAVTDREGCSASVLQSTYFDWGSGVVVGDTGILWQNRGAAFSINPDDSNAIVSGKRPFYTLNPGIAMRNGKPAFLYGTQGADGQPQTLSMLLTRLIDFGQSPSQALAGPRFLLGKTFSDSRSSLKLEADIELATVSNLVARGHIVERIPALSPLAGQAGVIAISEAGVAEGAHDPRGEGVAIAL